MARPPKAGERGLELREVSRAWKRPQLVTVLDGVDLEVPPGTLCWIGGDNGVGKTTLLRIVAGMLEPDSGSLEFDGLPPASYRRCLGFLSAGDRGLQARITVRQQLAFWARIALVPAQVRSGRIARAVDAFGLETFAERRTDQISLGQRQRVRLALAFLHGPRLVLLDEPANSLDDEGVRQMRAAAEHVADDGGVVIWCSPPSERSTMRSDLAFVLDGGKLCQA